MSDRVKTYAPLLQVDASHSLSLQEQLRRHIVAAIAAGIFVPGQKLPSSRKLSRAIGVSRTTVDLTYQLLIANGHLISKHRSGVYVAQAMTGAQTGSMGHVYRVASQDIKKADF